MWKLWLLFDPRRVLVATAIFLFSLALIIHFIVLSTAKYQWIEGPAPAAPAAQIEGIVIPGANGVG
jgi:light-harvesting complex 1 alpha chain